MATRAGMARWFGGGLLVVAVALVGAKMAQGAEWTVLVYLNADNNLDSFGVDDLNESAIFGLGKFRFMLGTCFRIFR